VGHAEEDEGAICPPPPPFFQELTPSPPVFVMFSFFKESPPPFIIGSADLTSGPTSGPARSSAGRIARFTKETPRPRPPRCSHLLPPLRPFPACCQASGHFGVVSQRLAPATLLKLIFLGAFRCLRPPGPHCLIESTPGDGFFFRSLGTPLLSSIRAVKM